jgi:hypothetical protein
LAGKRNRISQVQPQHGLSANASGQCCQCTLLNRVCGGQAKAHQFSGQPCGVVLLTVVTQLFPMG